MSDEENEYCGRGRIKNLLKDSNNYYGIYKQTLPLKPSCKEVAQPKTSSSDKSTNKNFNDCITLSSDEENSFCEKPENVTPSLAFSKDRSPTPPPDDLFTSIDKKKPRMTKAKRATLNYLEIMEAEAQKIKSNKRDSDTDIFIVEDSSPVKKLKHSNFKIKCRGKIHTVKMLRTDTFKLVYQEISKKENLPESQLLLYFDEEKVYPFQTPESLGLLISDIIECYVTDGKAEEDSSSEEYSEDPSSIKISIQGSKMKSKLKLSVLPEEKFETILWRYAKKKKVESIENIKIQFDGDDVDQLATPASLGMEDGDCIDLINF